MVQQRLVGNFMAALLAMVAFSVDALWARDKSERGSGSNQGGQSVNRGGGNSGSRNFSGSGGGGGSSRSSSGGNPGAGSSRSFSGGNPGGSSSRNFSGGGGSSRNSAPRTFDAPKVDAKQFSTRDLAPRVQPQPRQRVDTFRAPTVENKGSGGGRDASKFNKPNDTPRFDASKGGQSDRAADAIQRAQQQVKTRDLGSSGRVRTDKPLEGPKFDQPNFDKPDLDKPNLGNSRRESLDRIKRPGDLPNNNLPNNSNNLTRDGRNGSKFDRLPNDARETLDRANRNPDLKKDLNLGNKFGKPENFNKPDSGRITNDLDKMGLDRGKFDRGGNADTGRPDRDKFDPGRNPARDGEPKNNPNFNRGDAGKNFTVDKDKRERYDMLHHRIKQDPTRGIDKVTAAKLSRQNWQEKSDRNHYDQLAKHDKFQNIHLDKQYRMHDRGDVSRRMDFHHQLKDRGGWQHRNVGFVSANYRNHCSYRNYCGPSWYPRRCWYPIWNSWVSWSWGFNCNPWYDPRPIFCRPVIYDPCPRWVVWQYPVWQPLPVVAAGTWVDVPQVAVAQGWDVRLLAARFVDPGHLEQGLGARYRVWIRNDSETDVDQPFNVVLMGTNDLVPGDRRLEIGQRVPSIEAGQTIALDLRLPISPEGGEPMQFEKLHVLVDANRELNDTEMTNNGAVIDRGEVIPVDPASFNVDSDIANAGDVITIAGEGLGPEAGQVLLQVGNETYQPEILGWYDLGVQVRVPDVVADGLTTGDLVIVRGDGAAANPLTLQIAGAAGGRTF